MRRIFFVFLLIIVLTGIMISTGLRSLDKDSSSLPVAHSGFVIHDSAVAAYDAQEQEKASAKDSSSGFSVGDASAEEPKQEAPKTGGPGGILKLPPIPQ